MKKHEGIWGETTFEFRETSLVSKWIILSKLFQSIKNHILRPVWYYLFSLVISLSVAHGDPKYMILDFVSLITQLHLTQNFYIVFIEDAFRISHIYWK
jgi:hypothetical protein